MNEFYSFLGLLALYAGMAGTAFLAGRIFRDTTRAIAVRDRLARITAADSHPDTGTNLDGFTVPDDYGHGGTLPGSHRHRNDDGPAFYLAQHRDARSSAVLRDNLGARPGRHVAGGDPRGTDETAVA